MAQRPLYVKTIEGWKEINGEMYVKTASNWKPGSIYGRKESGWKKATTVENWVWHQGTMSDPYHWQFLESDSGTIRNYAQCTEKGNPVTGDILYNDPRGCDYVIYQCVTCGGQSIQDFTPHNLVYNTCVPIMKNYGSTEQLCSQQHKRSEEQCLNEWCTYVKNEVIEPHSPDSQYQQLDYQNNSSQAVEVHKTYCPDCAMEFYSPHHAVYSENPADHKYPAEFCVSYYDGIKYYGTHRWPCEDCGGYDTVGYEGDCNTDGSGGYCTVCGCYPDGTPADSGSITSELE